MKFSIKNVCITLQNQCKCHQNTNSIHCKLRRIDLRIYIGVLKTPNSQSYPEQKGNVEDILTLDLDDITELW